MAHFQSDGDHAPTAADRRLPTARCCPASAVCAWRPPSRPTGTSRLLEVLAGRSSTVVSARSAVVRRMRPAGMARRAGMSVEGPASVPVAVG
ncbi:hypothetical protein A6A08_18045 [Nocardiopsis sp. TSRI0078]|nr:hypothetical protein A6A08_18045 [Nocardiopsis sp. TSRI0078]